MSSLADVPSELRCKKIIYTCINKRWSDMCQCGGNLVWRINLDYGWCKSCRKKIRPKGLSWLSDSNLTCRQILLLITCWQKRRSPGSAVDITGLSYPTIRRWYKRFREHLPPDDDVKLSGIVEVDEAYFGKKRFNNQVIVLGAIERCPDPSTGKRRLKLELAPNTERESLEPFIERHIEIGSLVVTDCKASYSEITLLGFEHEAWNHSKGHFAGTNHIEQNWSAMKRYLRKLYNRIPTKDIQLVLNEWQARHNQSELFISPENYLRKIVPD